MFCRQLLALMTKNFVLKKRLWKQTIWELIVPLICGIFGGYISFTPQDGSLVSLIQYFQEIATVYWLMCLLITLSFAGSCTFILNQMVVDKENKMRETLKIMSATRTTYTLSYYLTQGTFVLVSSAFVSIGILWTYDRGYSIGAGIKMLVAAIMLFGSALISIAMALTTLFTDSKLSPQVGMYLLLLPSSIFFYMITNRL